MVEEKKYSYDRFASRGKRVGQAVVDILNNNPAPQTVEETLEAFGKDYLEHIRECAEKEKKNFDTIFYIFSLLNKDLHYFGVENVIRHWVIPRQTSPLPSKMMVEYKHHTKTLFEVDVKNGEITLLWTLPSYQDCLSILKKRESHDPLLIKWIEEALENVIPVVAQTH